jgi:DNA polymerase-4
MPSMTAGRLCPDGIFVRPRMDTYREESREIMRIVASFAGELVQQVSVDEAYLEVTGQLTEGEVESTQAHDALLTRAVPLAEKIKAAIREARGLTATVGIAPNKLLAKIASSNFKPDGLTLVLESEKRVFLRPLPVGALHGVGKVTEQALHKAGIRTVADLQAYPGDLRPYVGSWAAELKKMAFGEDDRALELGDDVKSISSENTFLRDTAHRPTLRDCLREQADEISTRMQKRRLAARTVQVKVRYSDFTTLTRQISVEEPISDKAMIYRLSCWLLARHQLVKRPLRLLGVGTSGLVDVITWDTQLPLPLEWSSSPQLRRSTSKTSA